MKNIFKLMGLVLLAGALTLASCSKEEDTNNSGNNNAGGGNNGGSSTIAYTDYTSNPVVYGSGVHPFIPGVSSDEFNYTIEDGFGYLISIYETGAGIVSETGVEWGYDNVALLAEGTEIGASSRFTSNNSVSLYMDDNTTWYNRTGYVGFKMAKNGATHYGWAKIKVDNNGVTIYGIAYEQTANKSIKAGQK